MSDLAVVAFFIGVALGAIITLTSLMIGFKLGIKD